MFQPVVPLPGVSGWVFLQNTIESQSRAFDTSPEIVRDTEYFEQKIGEIRNAEDLVNDRRLLRVALGAFGLQDDIDNRHLIKTVLDEGSQAGDALANRLADDRYAQLSAAFGFGATEALRTIETGFGREITDLFRIREFEVAVGVQNEAMRLGLNADRELSDIAKSSSSEDARWFRILGTPPLRAVFETALGLPDGFAQLDIDRQLDIFKEKSRDTLGLESLDALADDDTREESCVHFLFAIKSNP
ncbi:DUF1217 domain-containing protein [Roseovarius phycicola]|uniref:DUF1217 domain-containing protein n=1 Tax=Roseovarius phycicola TaxID=3080976 RepID=A0ABZ2HHU5_9RHOB